jgi:predicted nucleotidyltransferase
MLYKTDILNFLRANKEYFKTKFNIIKIGIFGSYAREEQTDNSDIDIIIEFEENTDEAICFNMLEAVNKIFNISKSLTSIEDLKNDYFGIDDKEVWQIIHNKLPELKIKLEKILV